MGKIKGLAKASTSTGVIEAAFNYSPQQAAFYDTVQRTEDNIILEARAGTGKTTTLVELCRHIQGNGQAVFLAFNKAISVEIAQRLAAANITDKEVKAATFHSVGFQAWKRHAPKSVVQGEKLAVLAVRLGVPQPYQWFCRQLVSFAKQALIGVTLPGVGTLPMDDPEPWLDIIDHFDMRAQIPQTDNEVDEEEYIETALAWALNLLRASIEEAPNVVDFDDMLYMPLYRNLQFWRYKWVMIDEAQDTNLARREIAKRLLDPIGRLIAVGDRHQAIYGFTGADSDALDLIAEDFRCVSMPLTTTYRCAAKIVRIAQRWVPDIQARDDAPEGQHLMMEQRDFMKLRLGPDDAVLCRNMRPLVEVAFHWLRQQHPCVIEGKEIGASLISMAKKWKTARTLGDLVPLMDEHLQKERARLLGQYKEAQAQTLEDKITTLLVLCDSLGLDSPVWDLTDLITRMFKDSDGLERRVTVLSTIHKAKGREWDTVYLLGRNAFMPSPYAKQDWQLEQEHNLAYVAVTRAKNTLVDVIYPEQKRRR